MSDPVTHDFTVRRRGHDFSIMTVGDGGLTLRLMGWGGDRPGGQRPEEGDYLILPNKDETTRYRVVTAEHYRDPPDMWVLTAEFSPRPGPNSTE